MYLVGTKEDRCYGRKYLGHAGHVAGMLCATIMALNNSHAPTSCTGTRLLYPSIITRVNDGQESVGHTIGGQMLRPQLVKMCWSCGSLRATSSVHERLLLACDRGHSPFYTTSLTAVSGRCCSKWSYTQGNGTRHVGGA